MNRPPKVLADRVALIMGVGALIALAALIATSPTRRVYDERWHLRYTEVIADSGWLPTMTAKSSDHSSGVGPVFPAMHLVASPLTGLRQPAVRWINYLCLLAVIATLARSVPSESRQRALIGASAILAVPFLWPTVGMALTELPALVPFSLFVLCMTRALAIPDGTARARAYKWAAGAGAFLGLAILARQTYLAVTPGLPLLLLFAPGKWRLSLITAAVATIVCIWLFVVWGGLIPPYAAYHDTNIDPRRVVLSLGYIAVATVLINPRWLWPRNVRWFLVGFAASLAVAMLIFDYTYLPGQALFARFGELGLLMAVAAKVAMTVVGFLWAWTAAQRALEERGDIVRVFLYLMLFALVAAPALGFEFSSRYVVGAIGVLLLVTGTPLTGDRWFPLRLLVGSAAGAMSLLRYYRIG